MAAMNLVIRASEPPPPPPPRPNRVEEVALPLKFATKHHLLMRIIYEELLKAYSKLALHQLRMHFRYIILTSLKLDWKPGIIR